MGIKNRNDEEDNDDDYGKKGRGWMIKVIPNIISALSRLVRFLYLK